MVMTELNNLSRWKLVITGTLLVVAGIAIASAAYFIYSAASGIAYVRDELQQATDLDDSTGPTIVKIEGESSPAGAKVAPRLSGLSGWLNTPSPLSLDELRGKTVLLDFWTYSCVNCIRTIPHLKSWHEKYADHGLVIIGVHSPEFEFEKISGNIQEAITRYELPYAVAMDNDFETWDDYNVLYWPTKFLVDANGNIRYTLVGEGRYEETEKVIRELLVENGASLDSVTVGGSVDVPEDGSSKTPDPETSLTVELFAGYMWSDPNAVHYIRNPEFYYQKDESRMYQDPGHRRNNFIFLQGAWLNGAEYITHGRQTANLEDYIAVTFNASSVNAVLAPKSEGQSFEVVVTLDGEYLSPEQMGEDVVIRKDGASIVKVDTPRMYQIVDLPSFQTRALRLSSDSDHFSLYSFTFGAYPEGP